jgi:hypothetical protein
LHGGLPVIDIGLSEQSYNTLVSESIRTGNDGPLTDAITKAVAINQMAMSPGRKME